MSATIWTGTKGGTNTAAISAAALTETRGTNTAAFIKYLKIWIYGISAVL